MLFITFSGIQVEFYLTNLDRLGDFRMKKNAALIQFIYFRPTFDLFYWLRLQI